MLQRKPRKACSWLPAWPGTKTFPPFPLYVPGLHVYLLHPELEKMQSGWRRSGFPGRLRGRAERVPEKPVHGGKKTRPMFQDPQPGRGDSMAVQSKPREPEVFFGLFCRNRRMSSRRIYRGKGQGGAMRPFRRTVNPLKRRTVYRENLSRLLYVRYPQQVHRHEGRRGFFFSFAGGRGAPGVFRCFEYFVQQSHYTFNPRSSKSLL